MLNYQTNFQGSEHGQGQETSGKGRNEAAAREIPILALEKGRTGSPRVDSHSKGVGRTPLDLGQELHASLKTIWAFRGTPEKINSSRGGAAVLQRREKRR
jgi:hypothetical protein